MKSYDISKKSNDEKIAEVCALIESLKDPQKITSSLARLLKYKDEVPDLACYLWYSYGTMTVLILELIQVYPFLQSGKISQMHNHHICSCLTLLQCVASHNETKNLFVKALIPLFLYPFLSNTFENVKSHEFLRLTALGVLGALVRGDSPVVLNFLLESDAISLFLRIMESSSDLLRSVSTFILLKVLFYEKSLSVICRNPECFYGIVSVLRKILETSGGNISARLLKHVLRCILCLTKDPKGYKAISAAVPPCVLTAQFTGIYDPLIEQDSSIRSLLDNILKIVNNECAM